MRPSLVHAFACLAAMLGGAEFARADLIVSNTALRRIDAYDEATGGLRGVFASGGGLVDPLGVTFGPDFASLTSPHDLLFGPDGNL